MLEPSRARTVARGLRPLPLRVKAMDAAEVIDVDQVDYEDKTYFHSEVLQAITCGVDVLIYTCLDGMSLQKKIEKWT